MKVVTLISRVRIGVMPLAILALSQLLGTRDYMPSLSLITPHVLIH
jgi:hypothetical protein